MPVQNPEWRFPVRLVTSGVIRDLWKSKDLERGNASAVSVLPVLALHVSPQSTNDAWTGVYRLPYLEIAELSGVGHGSVGMATTRLRSAGLFQRRTLSRSGRRLFRSTKGQKKLVFYRLNAKELYPQHNEPYVSLPASLIVSKTWADLLPAGRVLYLVLRCLEGYPASLSEIQELSGLPRRTFLRASKAILERAKGEGTSERSVKLYELDLSKWPI